MEVAGRLLATVLHPVETSVVADHPLLMEPRPVATLVAAVLQAHTVLQAARLPITVLQAGHHLTTVLPQEEVDLEVDVPRLVTALHPAEISVVDS